jgi:NADP-dependent 3-hydroxy acid dehydrogenase YdfG
MIAQALEANGATVYIIGRRKASLEQAAATAVCASELRIPQRKYHHARSIAPGKRWYCENAVLDITLY